ncbi:MAG: metallophosphoesterase, partial [Wenzhouxiangellaceae bacterium]
MPTKLLQVSDCHLARDPNAEYRGQNADANLDRLTRAVLRWAPDLLVLTGDLSEDASTEGYTRICDWAARFDCPIAWIPGNHDDRAVMAQIFEHAGFLSGPVIEAGGWQLALLDSALLNDPGGELDDDRLAPLAELDD